MVTYKLLLDQRRSKANGKYPINIRVTHDRKASHFYTGISVFEKEWDFESNLINKLCPGYKNLNKSITNKFLTIQKHILEMEDIGKFSLLNLSKKLTEKELQLPQISFLNFSNKIISQLKETSRVGNAIVYNTGVQRLIKFAGTPQVTFEDIDFAFLDRFIKELQKEGIKTNSIGNYLRSIRAIYNIAIKSKVIQKSYYPFNELSIKTERTAKRAITKEDIRKIYKSYYKIYTPKWHARNYFLLSFCLRGISFTDLAYLSKENIINGRVIYKRRKTGSQLNIQLLPLAKEILEAYSNKGHKYLLPVLHGDVIENGIEAKKIILQWIKTTNKWLRRIAEDCKIELDITTYVTRHSWATIAKSLGYSNELIAEGLGHEYGNKITNIYLGSFDLSVLDKANSKIVAAIIKI